jgi:hypothetical protein
VDPASFVVKAATIGHHIKVLSSAVKANGTYPVAKRNLLGLVNGGFDVITV